MVRKNHSPTRRNVIRSVAGIGSLSAFPLVASATGAADSRERTKYYEIDDDGDLVYIGPDHGGDNYLSKAVSGFNKAKGDGEIRFEEEDGRVTIVPVDSTESVSSFSSVTTTAADCSGRDDYQTRLHWQGLRHIFWFDDCTTTEIRNKLVGGAVLSEVAAVVANFVPGIGQGAAAVAACAGILMGGGATLLTANNEGRGVKLWFHGPNLADIDIYEIRTQ
ncbi:hypothetical protein [Natrinema sp. 1APR25-10V2]|uniref:hypothetical protein n=1 Tax=Natrinema sp. 1APR25-10V2 TaxID=2951081 RepID=UPI002876D9F7|nr:hypothetical protein [Natrinema sp. 1APR25-10V2]MDS0476257.1 hypothetical protein [Natrinema sp. 1APR25-10V2]